MCITKWTPKCKVLHGTLRLQISLFGGEIPSHLGQWHTNQICSFDSSSAGLYNGLVGQEEAGWNSDRTVVRTVASQDSCSACSKPA